jgi:hypothetical protein
MDQCTSQTKIVSFFEKELQEELCEYIEDCKSGDLQSFEDNLWQFTLGIYNSIASLVLNLSSKALEQELREKARAGGLRKLESRPVRVQIRTGYYVKVQGLYARQVPRGYEGKRQLLSGHWKLLRGASPSYYSTVCLFSIVSPSFEVASHILTVQGVEHNRDRLQKLCSALGQRCKDHQAELSRKPGETLKGKRVLIGIDGGRTRMREYTGLKNAAGNARFNTPWMEPKMFVIEVLDEQGNLDRRELPLYGCLFGDDEVFDLLDQHLKGLEIDQAEQVQVVADGAPWIWNRVKQRLIALGVSAQKIVETVDFYHASEYVHKIVAGLPRKLKKKASGILRDFKQWLWEGNIESIVEQCNQYFNNPSQEINRYINYLDKNTNRMKYQQFRNQKLVCGSGVIESGIRRVINLRFKNASAFWNPKNVEMLYFLRATLLAFRWNTLIDNLVAD